jgi:hypothetical protein
MVTVVGDGTWLRWCCPVPSSGQEKKHWWVLTSQSVKLATYHQSKRNGYIWISWRGKHIILNFIMLKIKSH